MTTSPGSGGCADWSAVPVERRRRRSCPPSSTTPRPSSTWAGYTEGQQVLATGSWDPDDPLLIELHGSIHELGRALARRLRDLPSVAVARAPLPGRRHRNHHRPVARNGHARHRPTAPRGHRTARRRHQPGGGGPQWRLPQRLPLATGRELDGGARARQDGLPPTAVRRGRRPPPAGARGRTGSGPGAHREDAVLCAHLAHRQRPPPVAQPPPGGAQRRRDGDPVRRGPRPTRRTSASGWPTS